MKIHPTILLSHDWETKQSKTPCYTKQYIGGEKSNCCEVIVTEHIFPDLPLIKSIVCKISCENFSSWNPFHQRTGAVSHHSYLPIKTIESTCIFVKWSHYPWQAPAQLSTRSWPLIMELISLTFLMANLYIRKIMSLNSSVKWVQ